jgi:hypothetical protein
VTAAVTVPHGQSITVPLSFSTQIGGIVSAVCYNLPALATCSYNKGNILSIGTDPNTPAGTYQVLIVCNSSSLTQTAGLSSHATLLYGFLGFPLGLLTLYRGRKYRRRAWSALCGLSLLLVIGFAIGCGSSVTSNSTSSPSVAAQASTTVTLTVK